jgi:hypothetical protein
METTDRTPTSLTRAELYELVWSIPITSVAKTVGISGAGLAKLCRRHQIPCPPRGYWAKQAHGQGSSGPRRMQIG